MRFRLLYSTRAELEAEVKQMAHGGVLVRDPAAARLAFDTPVVLELVMPDGTSLVSGGKVLQALQGLGVAVTVERHVIEQARKIVDSMSGEPASTSAPATSPPPAAPSSDTPRIAPISTDVPRSASTSSPPSSTSYSMTRSSRTSSSPATPTPPSGTPTVSTRSTATSAPPTSRTGTTMLDSPLRAPASSEPPARAASSSAPAASRTGTTILDSRLRAPATQAPATSPPASGAPSDPVASRTGTTLLSSPLRPPAVIAEGSEPPPRILTPRTGTAMLSSELRPPASATESDDYEAIETSVPAELEDAPSAPAKSAPDEPTQAQKIQLALHGTRDQRNAILRDRNRGLHAFVLKNPGLTLDDVLAIAKNPQMGPEMYKQISERPDWFQKPQVALALARNPKVPGDIALRALAHVAPDALRQLAKGAGAPPHVVQAARKRVIDR